MFLGLCYALFIYFYRAACNATHGIAVAILSVRPSVRPSVRLSVCLSVRCVYCDKTRRCTADILIPHETAVTLIIRHQHWLVSGAPFSVKYSPKVTHPFEKRRLRPISAYDVSTVRDSEKSSIATNRKLTTGFPTSYR